MIDNPAQICTLHAAPWTFGILKVLAHRAANDYDVRHSAVTQIIRQTFFPSTTFTKQPAHRFTAAAAAGFAAW